MLEALAQQAAEKGGPRVTGDEAGERGGLDHTGPEGHCRAQIRPWCHGQVWWVFRRASDVPSISQEGYSECRMDSHLAEGVEGMAE